ncbi:unnamed protein product [Rotaria sp. Silwood2]|nr:unnamed protein product [Rotaria sp. Silwood2]
MKTSESASEVLQKAVHYLTDLNLFPSVPPSTNMDELRTQRISTRVFIVSLMLSLTILIIYTSAVSVTKTVTIQTPDINQYKQLYERYQKTLSCPCKQVSIDYKTFLHINYTLHQVCSSDFVTDKWISLLTQMPNVELFYPTDFRFTSIQIFQALKAFCELMEQWVLTNLVQFYANNYVSAFVTAVDLFESQSETLIQQFISSTTNNFLLSLRLIRDTTQANALLAGHQSNYILHTNSKGIYLDATSMSYNYGCTCASNAACTTNSKIYEQGSSPSNWTVQGFYTGCLASESLYQSNLECLYNQLCLAQLKSYMGFNISTIGDILNSSIASQFLPNTTIGVIMDRLMIEEWNWSIIYDDYYSQCQPSKCDATLITKNNVIYIVTTLISLIGGLFTALKLSVPRFVWLIWHKRRPEEGIL